MNTKEKLNMLWKYLLLLVIAFGIFRISDRPYHKRKKHHFEQNSHEMTVEVEKEIVDGDTVMVVEINGEEISVDDLDELEHGLKWMSKDGKEIIIELDEDDEARRKEVKIIKKKIVIEDDK
jgi:hypothetical protein